MKGFSRILLLSAVCLVSLAGSRAPAFDGQPSPSERPHDPSHKLIRVRGGGAAVSWMFGPATHQAFEEETGIDIDVVASSPGEGLVDLLQGRADLATAAVPLEAMLKLAAQAGIPMDPGLLVQTPIATNHTLVFVHPSNPVQRLSAGELRGIFTGKTTNWKEVGGTDRAIDVVWGSKTPGQNGLFTAQILGGAAVTAKAVGATDYRDIRQKVSEDPGAVGIDSDGFASGAVRIPETPDITSSIIVVTKGEPNPEVRRLLRFLAEVEREL